MSRSRTGRTVALPPSDFSVVLQSMLLGSWSAETAKPDMNASGQ